MNTPLMMPPAPPSIVAERLVRAVLARVDRDAVRHDDDRIRPDRRLVVGGRADDRVASPPAPPRPIETETTWAFAVAWFDVRERTVSEETSPERPGRSPSKLAFVVPPAFAVGIITEIERPIESEFPSATAVAWFAEVAKIWTPTPGASIVEVEPTSACVEASLVTSASEDAPAPEPISPAEKMSAVAVALFATSPGRGRRSRCRRRR